VRVFGLVETKTKMTLQELPELLTLKQASALINVHPNTLRNWEREGKVKAVRIGTRRDRRFLKASVWNIYQPVAKEILR
jgi:excisionase family DNA binding protein